MIYGYIILVQILNVELIGFAVLTVKTMNSIIFWDEMPCSFVAVYRHLREMHCFHLHCGSYITNENDRKNM